MCKLCGHQLNIVWSQLVMMIRLVFEFHIHWFVGLGKLQLLFGNSLFILQLCFNEVPP